MGRLIRWLKTPRLQRCVRVPYSNYHILMDPDTAEVQDTACGARDPTVAWAWARPDTVAFK